MTPIPPTDQTAPSPPLSSITPTVAQQSIAVQGHPLQDLQRPQIDFDHTSQPMPPTDSLNPNAVPYSQPDQNRLEPIGTGIQIDPTPPAPVGTARRPAKKSTKKQPTLALSAEQAEIEFLKIQLNYSKTKITLLESDLSESRQRVDILTQNIKVLEDQRTDLSKQNLFGPADKASVSPPSHECHMCRHHCCHTCCNIPRGCHKMSHTTQQVPPPDQTSSAPNNTLKQVSDLTARLSRIESLLLNHYKTPGNDHQDLPTAPPKEDNNSDLGTPNNPIQVV